MTLRSVLLAIAGVLVGFAGHVALSSAHTGSPPAQNRSADNTAAPGIAPPPACAADWGAMRDEVKQAVRDVLREDHVALPHDVAADGGAVGGGASQTQETDDNKQARDEEAALLAVAIDSGHWTQVDVTKLRTLIPRMAPADRGKALAALSKAINDHRLKIDAVPPF